VGAAGRVGILTISGCFGGVCGPFGPCAASGTLGPEAQMIAAVAVTTKMWRFIFMLFTMQPAHAKLHYAHSDSYPGSINARRDP
jgi:hypothetical protein